LKKVTEASFTFSPEKQGFKTNLNIQLALRLSPNSTYVVAVHSLPPDAETSRPHSTPLDSGRGRSLHTSLTPYRTLFTCAHPPYSELLYLFALHSWTPRDPENEVVSIAIITVFFDRQLALAPPPALHIGTEYQCVAFRIAFFRIISSFVAFSGSENLRWLGSSFPT
jgi:hypothetical protein